MNVVSSVVKTHNLIRQKLGECQKDKYCFGNFFARVIISNHKSLHKVGVSQVVNVILEGLM